MKFEVEFYNQYKADKCIGLSLVFAQNDKGEGVFAMLLLILSISITKINK